ncbi:TAXI family TRAP transporter solute-binding subunit [Reyranella sp. CPCC 100927]|uniref:TAXI family TRAP transporter solute-binding subunit n=1 Tax=Reyranella sp. CPCC 100927 TaxID=2599616 RepID=UPI0011B4A4E3|nr:TAXI family TRAP transporter solute-binding subunit [Reyranella sp. CPCC 100927]TWS94462.1 TAXI family TRAP transporter solute-binding subunit [Reyranella sp. CPCC 100927]
MIDRRRFLTLSAVATTGAFATTGAPHAQQVKFFRIGTGGTAGTYYPLAGVIANAISNPPGSRACDQGGSCGVPGLVATAVASNGSVANVNAVNGGSMESGFTQSDVAYWAYTGTGLYEGKPKVESLRLIANLYPESIHLVARKGSGLKSVADLKGKRVSLDEPGSGTLVDARMILAAFGLTEKDIKAEYLKPQQSADKLKDGALDAFVSVTGYPQGAISELAATSGIELVPVEGPGIDKMLAQYTFFARDEIPTDAYKGVAGAKTISVNAQWVTSAKQSDDLVYEVTKALWNDNTRKLLDAGHAKGKTIQLKTALAGAGIPVHPGAERFYKEKGVAK